MSMSFGSELISGVDHVFEFIVEEMSSNAGVGAWIDDPLMHHFGIAQGKAHVTSIVEGGIYCYKDFFEVRALYMSGGLTCR